MTLDETVNDLQTEAYKHSSATEKREMLWSAVVATRYKRLPPVRFSLTVTGIKTLFLSQLRKIYSEDQDVLPKRNKTFHPSGIVAQISLIPDKRHPFTGLFRTGAIGVIRSSLAMNERFYIPGGALKFFIDGQPSRNVPAVPGMDPQKSRDYFERPLTNIIPAPRLLPFGPFWKMASWWMIKISNPLDVSVEALAAAESDGQRVAHPKSPHKICLMPQVHLSRDTTEDFRSEFGKISAGTMIYSVFGASQNDSGEWPIHIADIQTDSEYVASAFGDRVLAMHHTK